MKSSGIQSLPCRGMGRGIRTAVILWVLNCCLSHSLAAQVSSSALREVHRRPNVILCMTDDQGWGDVGYNGHPVLRTPFLDQMSEEGLRFERFYASSPVCSPTRGSCLTGRHPYRYGVTHANVGHLKPQEITLAEVLQRQDYATGHFGKWHLGTLTTELKDANRGRPGMTRDYSPPWQNGFDVCFSTESKVPTSWTPAAYSNFGTYYWNGPGNRVPATEITGDDSVLVMNQVLPFVRDAAQANRPFLAVIWFHAPICRCCRRRLTPTATGNTRTITAASRLWIPRSGDFGRNSTHLVLPTTR